jgi:hypothetical protein
MWFVRVNVVRDHLALNDTEVSPWDTWRQASGPHLSVSEADQYAIDRIAQRPDTVKQDIAPPWLG